jgi:hypothetical protein
MDVIGFLCASIGSRTVQLHVRLGRKKERKKESKTAVIDVIGFLCASIGSRIVQLHVRLGSRRACAYSEAGFSSQNGDRAWGVYYRRAAL